MNCALSILLVFLAASAMACDRDSAHPVKAKSASNTASDQPAGSIVGRVTIAGWKPALTQPKIQTCGNQQVSIVDQTVAVNSDNSLRNVVVYVKDAPISPESLPAEPAVLDQIGCNYVPHVVALRTGQTLRIRNSDATMHNIHTQSQENTPMNFGQINVDSRDLVFKTAETFRVKCDVHPWMNAYVAVFDHPYFDVTHNGGTFEVKNVPPGSYILAAWHEKFDEQTFPLVVRSGHPTRVDITFSPPAN